MDESPPEKDNDVSVPNYQPAAVIVTLFVCPVIGMLAMYLGCKSDWMIEEGRVDEARRLAELVKKWLIFSIPIGVISYALLLYYCFM